MRGVFSSNFNSIHDYITIKSFLTGNNENIQILKDSTFY